MIKSLKKNKTSYLRNKVVNTLMKSGKKKTGEKILLKFVKSLQKSTDKNSKVLLQLAVINSTSTFKLNEQSIKKGKRKAKKNIPAFIISDSLRITTALKLIVKVSAKNKNSNSFYQSLMAEILSSSASKGQSIDQKNELQKQILINKRYLSKFRW
jgi:ribosomal protein S7